MGKLSLSLVALGVAACGSDNNNPADAKVVIVPDAKMIDAPKVFNDAPPTNYDFTCFGMAAPTTAADPVSVSGITGSLSQSGLTPVSGVTVDFFKTGNATAVASTTSGAGGAFASGDVVTGGTPTNAYVRASLAANRTTYLYPPNPVVASLTNVPVPMISNSTFTLIQTVAQVTQDDDNNGVILAVVSDCALAGIDGADISAKQGGTEVGTQFDLGAVSQGMAPGTFAILNVPDGDTTLTASYNGMTFPVRTVASHKKIATVASVTSTAVVPGP